MGKTGKQDGKGGKKARNTKTGKKGGKDKGMNVCINGERRKGRSLSGGEGNEENNK